MESFSERLRRAGIVQAPDPILDRVADRFDLPDAAPEAQCLLEELLAAAERVRTIHLFSKGMGIAAPQIGSRGAAAMVLSAAANAKPVFLLNPRIASASHEQDEQYEGCLSFFDVRGVVLRPLRIEVVHTEIDGSEHMTVFEREMARLVHHEIDHLKGVPYTARMRPGSTLINLDEYGGRDSAWHYKVLDPSRR